MYYIINSGDNMTTIELLDILNQNKDVSFQELFEKIPDITFVAYLQMLLDTRHIKIADFIRKTNIERTYAYQILNGTRNPSKNKVLQCAFALSLDLHDTNILLTLSFNESLYPKVKRDALIIFGINHHYDLFKMNELLDEYNFKIIE